MKSKAILLEKVWFPCMDKMVETKVKAYLPCQIVTPVQPGFGGGAKAREKRPGDEVDPSVHQRAAPK